MNKIGDERMKGSLSLRGFRKLRTGAIVATGVFLIGLASVQTTVQASEEDGVWVARTVEQVKVDIQKEDNFFKYEIKWGDTLSVISEATNIPVDVLKEMNRISDRNLFLPHNELLYTEGENVTDSKTKHKIVIKESYGKKEVRTYEVVLQKNHETAEVTFELKETTEKVQESYTSVVSCGEVYNLVSDEAEGIVETSGEEDTVTPGATETPTPAQPAEEKPATPGVTETPAPVQPAEEQPSAPGATETPTPAQPAEEKPATPGVTETPAPVQPAGEQPAGSGATETPTPAQPAGEQPAAPGVTETPTPAQPAEEKPAIPGTPETLTPTPAQPAGEKPSAPGATETPAPAQPAEEKPATPGTTETPTPGQPAEEKPATPGATETPAPVQPAEEKPATPGVTETPTPAQPAETTPAGSGVTETPAPAQPAEEKPVTPGTTETPTPAQPAEEKPAGSGVTETPTPAQPTEEKPAASGTTETPADLNNQNNPNVPKDDVEKGLEENGAELESRKKIKLEEINSSSLSSSEKEAAKLKVEEYTNKAKEAMKQAKTTDDQASVVDQYDEELATIDTPGVDQGKPDYTNSGLSGNGPEGTNIGDNNVIGHGNSTPENTGFRSATVYQPRVTLRERNADELKNKVSIYYNYDGMKDIPGFFNDLDSKNEVEVPQKVPAQTLKSILKSKIDQKKAELERKGYKIADEYFVGINQENATHYDYVVTFTKA